MSDYLQISGSEGLSLRRGCGAQCRLTAHPVSVMTHDMRALQIPADQSSDPLSRFPLPAFPSCFQSLVFV